MHVSGCVPVCVCGWVGWWLYVGMCVSVRIIKKLRQEDTDITYYFVQMDNILCRFYCLLFLLRFYLSFLRDQL